MNFPILYLHHFFKIQPDHTFSRIAQPLSLINNDIADRSPIIWLSTVDIKSYIDKFFEVFFSILVVYSSAAVICMKQVNNEQSSAARRMRQKNTLNCSTNAEFRI